MRKKMFFSFFLIFVFSFVSFSEKEKPSLLNYISEDDEGVMHEYFDFLENEKKSHSKKGKSDNLENQIQDSPSAKNLTQHHNNHHHHQEEEAFLFTYSLEERIKDLKTRNLFLGIFILLLSFYKIWRLKWKKP